MGGIIVILIAVLSYWCYVTRKRSSEALNRVAAQQNFGSGVASAENSVSNGVPATIVEEEAETAALADAPGNEIVAVPMGAPVVHLQMGQPVVLANGQLAQLVALPTATSSS